MPDTEPNTEPDTEVSNSKNVIGQLTQLFQIPPYAQDMLYVVASEGAAQVRGKQGDFVFNTLPKDSLRLTWGTADGPVLAFWNNLSEWVDESVSGAIEDTGTPAASEGGSGTEWLNLRWDGRIKVGGFVERLHAREVDGRELIIAEVVGGPFPSSYVGLPSLHDMRNGVFTRVSEVERMGHDHSYPFIILAESNLAALVQDALVSSLAVDAYGVLASDAGGWHEIVGLPLLLSSITLLAP